MDFLLLDMAQTEVLFASANEVLQNFRNARPPTAPTLPLKLRDFGTSQWQLSNKVTLLVVTSRCRFWALGPIAAARQLEAFEGGSDPVDDSFVGIQPDASRESFVRSAFPQGMQF
jgi:hypothetical protein